MTGNLGGGDREGRGVVHVSELLRVPSRPEWSLQEDPVVDLEPS